MIYGKVQYWIWNPHRISKSKKKKKYSNRSIEGKYNIGFAIPIEFPSQRKKNIQIGPETAKLDICGQRVICGKVQYRI